MIIGRPFLFGKLPAIGDFAVRGLDGARRLAWDHRCTVSMQQVRRRFGADLAAVLDETPPLGFLLAPTRAEPCWQAGCVAPSCDRAGRFFPFVVGVAADEAWHVPASTIARSLVPVLHAGIAQGLSPDAALAAIGTALGAPGEKVAIEVMSPWRDDWIVPAHVPGAQENRR